MEEKKLGGKRKGAGRKPLLSKKKQISLYVEGAKIIKFGSEEKMKNHLYQTIEKFGETAILPESNLSIQDLTHPTHEIKPVTEQKPQNNVVISNLPPKPLASLFSAFEAEILKTNTIKEIEEVMRRVKGEAMLPKEKMILESIAKAHCENRGMYND